MNIRVIHDKHRRSRLPQFSEDYTRTAKSTLFKLYPNFITFNAENLQTEQDIKIMINQHILEIMTAVLQDYINLNLVQGFSEI